MVYGMSGDGEPEANTGLTVRNPDGTSTVAIVGTYTSPSAGIGELALGAGSVVRTILRAGGAAMGFQLEQRTTDGTNVALSVNSTGRVFIGKATITNASIQSLALGTNAAVSDWPESGGGITSAEAGTISTNVLAAYTNALPLPGCAILPVDPATSNAWITGAYEYYSITSNLTPVNLCISNTVRRIGYSVTMMTTQAVTLATNMVRIGAAWTPTGTNLVVIWPHCDAALWRVKGQAQ